MKLSLSFLRGVFLKNQKNFVCLYKLGISRISGFSRETDAFENLEIRLPIAFSILVLSTLCDDKLIILHAKDFALEVIAKCPLSRKNADIFFTTWPATLTK
ncbi:MAG: hypothetical protein GWN01_12390, partial [Nitrosopumilaceae archaeon]|nr:hypothetical protein [Nitrosopumilaceae archaeon]NIV65108.1 hypothetical protein [Nitrosopumilaceae archaeon]NIX62276.1 hypothetical protein [Nitrosopumilaceae archaeon]